MEKFPQESFPSYTIYGNLRKEGVVKSTLLSGTNGIGSGTSALLGPNLVLMKSIQITFYNLANDKIIFNKLQEVIPFR